MCMISGDKTTKKNLRIIVLVVAVVTEYFCFFVFLFCF